MFIFFVTIDLGGAEKFVLSKYGHKTNGGGGGGGRGRFPHSLYICVFGKFEPFPPIFLRSIVLS